MNLPFLGKKKETKEYFLALILSVGKISSILFEKTGTNLLILSTHSSEFEESLETLSSERLIELSDVVITEIENKLPEGAQLEKTIFAVPQSWVQEGKILKEHLGRLKRLCEALQLTPIGFIVSIEAIVAYLNKKEGAPVTALFVELGRSRATVTLVKNGNILSVYEGIIEKDSITTVEKILTEQTDLDVLPAKIILLNYEHVQKTQQKFLSHTWKKDLPFLHIPQVVVLDPGIESTAVISGVALQMGFENLIPHVPSTTSTTSLNETKNNNESLISEEIIEEKHPNKNTSEQEFAGEAVGFYKDIDVLKIESPKITPTHAVSEVFKEGNTAPQKNYENVEEIEENQYALPVHEVNKKTLFSFPSINTQSLKKFSTMLSSMPKLPGGKLFIYPVIILVIIIATIFGYYYFFEKAQVQVKLDKKQIANTVDVSFAVDKDTSITDNIIHITSKSIKVEGQNQQNVTGKKETGDKAKGEVVILSSMNKDQNIEKGTVLTSSNSLKFTLDSDVKIASSSGLSDIKSAKGKVSASLIGKEYNLPSNTKFTVTGFDTSSIEAKNDSAFSGGSKKEIKVFSADDQYVLTSKLEDNLSKKAIADFDSQRKKDENILPVPLSSTFEEKNFSKKVGDEAQTVSLSAIVTYDLGIYKKADIISFIKELSKNDTSSSYLYSDKDSKATVEGIKIDKNGVPIGKLHFDATFLPKVVTNEIASKLVGKSTDAAAEIAKGKGITDVQVVFLRSLPFFPKILPFNRSNIVIEVFH